MHVITFHLLLLALGPLSNLTAYTIHYLINNIWHMGQILNFQHEHEKEKTFPLHVDFKLKSFFQRKLQHDGTV